MHLCADVEVDRLRATLRLEKFSIIYTKDLLVYYKGLVQMCTTRYYSNKHGKLNDLFKKCKTASMYVLALNTLKYLQCLSVCKSVNIFSEPAL